MLYMVALHGREGGREDRPSEAERIAPEWIGTDQEEPVVGKRPAAVVVQEAAPVGTVPALAPVGRLPVLAAEAVRTPFAVAVEGRKPPAAEAVAIRTRLVSQ